jgi:predicted RND superfamily exporter protein
MKHSQSMHRYVKSTMMVIAGFCWIAVALAIGLFLFGYLAGGTGLQMRPFLFPVSSTTVVFGLIQFAGFVAAACFCFAVGVGLCAYGIHPAPKAEKRTAPQPR